MIGGLRFAAPLCAVERITLSRREAGWELEAAKSITANEPYLSGHFPSFAIFPGVFAIESLRQAVAYALGELEGSFPEIVSLRSIRFLATLLPGDTMSLHARIGPISAEKSFEVVARCVRNDGVLAVRMSVEFRYPGARHA